MVSFECTLVPNPFLDSAPDEALFWPTDRLRLVLLFENLADDKIVVSGIDPDVADRSALVFRADLASDQKARFVQAVISGLEPTLIPPSPVSNENRAPASPPDSSLVAQPLLGEVHSNEIVIVDPPGPGQGPKAYLLALPSSALATGTQG
jgi:hypothetical protein